MTILRSSLLLAVATLAVGLSVTNASAQDIQVVEELSGTPCNPCEGHVVGEAHIETGTGVIVSECSENHAGILGPSGNGEVSASASTESGVGCNTLNCSITPGEADWEVGGLEEEGPNSAHINVDFCLQAGSAEIECNANLPIFEHDPPSHHYEAEIAHHQCAPGRFVSGDWELEGRGLELVHL